MAENEPIKYSDLISPDDSIIKLQKQLDDIANALELVQDKAVTLSSSMKSMSGATRKGREEIDEAARDAMKLAKAQEDLAYAQSDTAKQLAYLNELKRIQNQRNKEEVKMSLSQRGSYDRLSARYSQLKREINAMNPVTEKARRAFEAKQKAAAKLYEQMNELQKATGRYTLEVGHYENAGKSMRSELKEITAQLQQMKLRGDENSVEYQKLISRAGELKDTMGDVSEAIKNTASDTSNLDAILGGASAVTGGFGLAIGAMSVLGVNTESVEKAQKKLQEAIALVNSVQAIANALNKDSALMTKLRAVAQKLLNKTMEENAVATNAATVATNKWKIALMTTGIGVFLVALGALVALYKNYVDVTASAEQKQMLFNQQIEKAEKKMNNASAEFARMRGEMAASGATEKELAQADKDNAEQMEANAKAIADARTKAFEEYAHQYNADIMLGKKHNDEEKKQYTDLLAAKEEADEKYKDAHSKYVIASYNLDNAIEEERKKNQEEQAERAKKLEEERKKQADERYQNELREQRALLALQDEYSLKAYEIQKNIYEKERDYDIKNGVEKETAQNEYLKKMRDLYDKFYKHREELNAKVLEEIEKEKEAEKKAADEIFDARKTLAEYWQETTLTDKEKERASVFKIIVEQESKALAALDKLAENGVEVTNEMYDKVFENTKKQMEKAEKELEKGEAKSFYSLLGFDLNSEQEQAINAAFSSAISSVNSYIDSLVALKEQAVDTANARVDSAQKALDAEIEARNAGYANSVETAQKELQLAKQQQQKAEQEAKKAQKIQQQLDTLQQTASLVTATANIWKAFTGIEGGAGIPLAMAATATMWGAFAAAKIKAAQVTKGTEKYGDGTVELLSGGSHASGNDIDLGMKTDGTRRRAEGGEFFAVINKRNSRKYRKVIPDVIRSINNDTFASKYLNANGKMAGALINIQNTNSTDLRQLQDDVRAIKKANEQRTYIDGRGFLVTVNGQNKRIIKR